MTIIKQIWKYFDLLCFITAIGFAICGFFLLNFIAGIFSVAVGFTVIGLLSERVAANLHQ